MRITFIESPLYQVDFSEFGPKPGVQESLSLPQRVKNAAFRSIELIKFFFISLGQATHRTFSNAGTSFKYIVLGYYGQMRDFHPPADIYLAIFKVGFWFLGLGWNILITTGRLFIKKVEANAPSYLVNFTSEINVEHIKTKELSINVDHVPSDVKVDNLAQIYNEVNFTNDQIPGYMAPLSRKEGTNQYSVAQLQESLNVFILKVKKREAFLGTPPASDIPRLMDFYQQIENAVRFSIHNSNQELAEFRRKNGTDVTKYSFDEMKKYKNILEDRSRIPLNLAIAGKHCGARYMGEAMDIYDSIQGENLKESNNLQDTIIELLALKRKAIAKQQIQRHLGFDTHAFNKYMGNLGELLAIPGTKNIIEHLDNRINRDLYIQHFFNEYTPDTIIDTIQAEIKKSQKFREKVIDWIKDQIKDWKKNEYADLPAEDFSKITAIIQAKTEKPESLNAIEDFQTLVNHLRSSNVQLPTMENGWSDFIDDLFVLGEVKEWCKNKFPAANRIEYLSKVQKFKSTLSEEKLGAELVKELKEFIQKNGALSMEKYQQKMGDLDKIKRIRQIIHLNDDTLGRVLSGKSNLKEAIKNQLDLDRRMEFLSHFPLETLKDNGLTPELMEWLLISHKVLLPQTEG